jgi:DNA-directed RNA polymerase subunit RPC12/RpoP
MAQTGIKSLMCPVCGGKVHMEHKDKANRCEYCGSPVLGPSQNRDCVNHEGILAKEVCHVCGDLVCEDCLQVRVGEYGGKLFTIFNCEKAECQTASSWAKPLNREYQRLTNFDWSDKADNLILRVTGLGAVLMMIFELVFVLVILWLQFFDPWGTAAVSPIDFLIIRGDTVIILSIMGNFLSAILLQTALQVYVHERQLASGMFLFGLLIMEAAFLFYRGLFFNLLSYPGTWIVPLLLTCFSFAVILVFVGSLGAIGVGMKKHNQTIDAKKILGLE